jgi:UDPglucose 6-dehydrogenase
MNIGLCGLGITGNAMKQSLVMNGFIVQNNLHLFDKYKKVYDDEQNSHGCLENLLICDIIFLSLPTLYDDITKQYDKSNIVEIINKLNDMSYKNIIIIKSTVEPTTTEKISQLYPNLNIIYVPEFLSSKTAIFDFHNQKHVVVGLTNKLKDDDQIINKIKLFYQLYYPDAVLSITNSTVAETMKISCNSFYAIKVQWFTELYLLCNKINIEYDEMKNLMIKNNWINSMHTNIPGHDGEISYGGFCFPKDTNALQQFMESLNVPNKLLKSCIEERNIMRFD